MNEIEQVTRAKAGDEVAWIAIVRHHQEAVFRLAYLLLGDADDAQDVAQEVFMRAYRALDHFDATRPLRPWLLEITRNQSSNWSRTIRRYLAAWQRWNQVTSVPPASAALIIDPSQQVMQQWKAQTLWQAVRRLKSNEQEIIYLRCFLELSVEETAQVLHVAPGTVKSRLWRALAHLRHVVEQEFPSLSEEANE